MTSTSFLFHRLGGLCCLYCLHETQPPKPPFRIYISIRELKTHKELVIDAKKENIGVVHVLVNSMLDRHLFFYGATDLQESFTSERVNELTDIQNAFIQHANKKLFADTEIERYIHVDMEAEKVVAVQHLKHIAENQTLIGDVVGETTQGWNCQKETFYQQIGFRQNQLRE